MSPASPVTSTPRKKPRLPYLLCLYRTLFRTDEAVAQKSLCRPALRDLEAFIKHLPEEEPEAGDPAATEAMVAGIGAVASISMALFGVRAEFWWPGRRPSDRQRHDAIDPSAVVRALLAVNVKCPFPGRLCHPNNGALSVQEVNEVLRRTQNQARIFNADKVQTTPPLTRQKATLTLESGGRLKKKSVFTVYTVPYCGAQKKQLADCVSNPHASGRRLYVTELVQRRIGTNENVTLVLKEPAVISVPAGCSARVASVQLICSRTGTDDARSHDAHFIW